MCCILHPREPPPCIHARVTSLTLTSRLPLQAHPAPTEAHLDAAFAPSGEASLLCAATGVLTLAAEPPACFQRSSLWQPAAGGGSAE